METNPNLAKEGKSRINLFIKEQVRKNRDNVSRCPCFFFNRDAKVLRGSDVDDFFYFRSNRFFKVVKGESGNFKSDHSIT